MKWTLSVFLFLLISIRPYAQEDVRVAQTHQQEITQFQDELNQKYRSPEDSPLDSKKRMKFDQLGGHQFFPFDSSYRVVASLEVYENPEVVMMKTSSTKIKHYNLYGKVRFQLNGKDIEVNIYQNKRLMKIPQYADALFFPFTDLTNGTETYGGGRYVDLKIPEDQTQIVIDFNKAYQPYCAYTYGYSCTVPPKENFIDTRIEAGVKQIPLMEDH